MSWLAALVVAACALNSARAFRAPERPGAPDIDQRPRLAPKAGLVAVDKAPAVAGLQARVPGVQIQWNDRLGAPEHIASRDGFLTGPDAPAPGVLPGAAPAVAGDSHRAIKAFLTEHSRVFGYGPEVLDTAVVKRDHTLEHNGLRSVHWEQQFQGVPVFESVLVEHITRQGELVSIATRLVPRLNQAVAVGARHLAVGATPPVSARQAVLLALQALGNATLTGQDLAAQPLAEGASAERFTARSVLSGPADARLVWLPLDDSNLRLCWQVVVSSSSLGGMYQNLLDVETGEILLRRNLTRNISAATFRVWTNDSPAPMTPGLPFPGTNQAPVLARSLLTFGAMSTNASPAGWVTDGTNATVGNNTIAGLVQGAAAYLIQGNPNRVFDLPCDLTLPAGNYGPASTVQTFYWMNFMHDVLYDLGFNEASGNFQETNFLRGGVGGDSVMAFVQDPQMPNNAGMATSPIDGDPPAMYSGVALFPAQTPGRDFALNADIMLHEYTHGLTVRVLGKGLDVPYFDQPGAVQEGNSDFFAMSALSQQEDDLGGTYPSGSYLLYQSSFAGGAPFAENYYYGIRRYPYSTNLAKNPLTYKDIDPTQASTHAGVPFSTLDLFTIATPADEVHNAGEVWAMVLWEMRASLVAKLGFTNGNPTAMRLVIDAMRLAPFTPSFLQMRDAILLADRINSGGANYYPIWSAFAKRGMGGDATSPANASCTGVSEAFNMPGLVYVGAILDDSSTGNGNGVIDFNECFILNVAVRNDSTNYITNIAGLLVSETPGVFVVDSLSPYPNLSIGAAAYNLLPFRVYTAPDFQCGAPIRFRFIHTSSLGTNDLTFTLPTGMLDPVPYSFNNNNSLFVPDASTNGVESTLRVGGLDGRLGKVVVSLYLNHPDSSQLTLALVGPDGASVLLASHKGGPGGGYGTGCASGSRVVFDDGADTFIDAAQAPVVGPFAPQSPLTAFKGKSGAAVNGTWRLRLSDDRAGLAGSLQCWSLTLNGIVCSEGGGGCAPDLEVSVEAKPAPVFVSQTLTYSITVTNHRTVPAYGVLLTNVLPANMVLLGVTNVVPASWTNVFTNINGLLVFNVGTVSNATDIQCDLLVTPQVAGLLTNVFTAGATNGDINLTNNTAVVLTDVRNRLPVIVASGVRLVAEANNSGGLESGERVTVQLSLANTGAVSTTNLLATLRPLNGVASPGPQAVYGIVAPGGAPVSQTFAFTVAAPAGGVVHAVLDLTDKGSLGAVEFLIPVGASGAFRSTGEIVINDLAPASPYPSQITVSGLAGAIRKATVTLYDFQHTYPQDVNALLVGPGGQSVLLMAHAGDSTPAWGIDLTFDSSSPPLPSGAPLAGGSFAPAAYALGAGYTFPAPAPAGPYSTSLDALDTSDPNGVWSLYVRDDSKFDSGVIASNWSLALETTVPVNPAASLAVSFAGLPQSVNAGQPFTARVVVANNGPLSASDVFLTNPVPAGVAFISGVSSQGSVSNAGAYILTRLGRLASNATVTLNFSAPAAPGAFTVSASVANAGPERDLYLGDNAASASIAVLSAHADLAVQASVAPAFTPALLGSNLLFAVTVTNQGPDDAFGFWVTNSFGAAGSVQIVSFTNSAGGTALVLSNTTAAVVTAVPRLASGQSATVTVLAAPARLGFLSNSVSLGFSTALVDPVSDNNQTNWVLAVTNPAPRIVIAGIVITNDATASIEPRKAVTAYFILRNDGQAPASSIVATLLATNDVVPTGAFAQAFGDIIPPPSGAAVSRPFTFNNTLSNQTTLTLILGLKSGATDLGVATVTVPVSTFQSFATNAYLTVPALGATAPYPSILRVPALSNRVSRVSMVFSNLSYSYLRDLSALITAPSGRNTLLLSHAGAGYGAASAAITFDDKGAPLPQYLTAALTGARTNSPTAFAPAAVFPAPAPAAPYGATLAGLVTESVAGDWSLYLNDEGSTANGSLYGWSITFTVAAPLPAQADLALRGWLSPAALNSAASQEGLQTCTLVVSNSGPSPATGVVVADLLPAGAVLLSNSLPASVTLNGAQVSWQAGSLQAGQSLTLTLYTRFTGSGAFAHTASVQGNEADPCRCNNTLVLNSDAGVRYAGPLVAAGSVWKYLDSGANAGSAAVWASAGFDDALWASGPARLGYGHGDERTVLAGGSPANRVVTTYFRQAFSLDSAARYTNLALRLLRVHGAVVYLNGVEFYRDNMPDGPIASSTLAASEVPTNAQSLFFTTRSLDRSLLKDGLNLLAVELHQAATNGYTLGFDLELLANAGVDNQPPHVALTAPVTGALIPSDVVTLSAFAYDTDGLILRVEYFATNLVSGAIQRVGQAVQPPYSVLWTNTPGAYSLVAVAWDNSAEAAFSPSASVTVVAPPTLLIDRGATWRYLDNGLDQGLSWTLPGYDDSIWASGQAELGFGDFPITQLASGPESNRFSTFYFRHPFVAPPGAAGNLSFDLKAVHGAIVYLNGLEVYRSNMPTGAVGYVTLALTNTPPAQTESYVQFYAPSTNLLTRPGTTNMLAVEVHQWSLLSSNLAFDLRLSAFPQPALALSFVNQSLVLSWPASSAGYVLESSPVLPGGTNWTPVSAPVFTNAGWSTLNTNASAGRQLYFRLHRP